MVSNASYERSSVNISIDRTLEAYIVIKCFFNYWGFTQDTDTRALQLTKTIYSNNISQQLTYITNHDTILNHNTFEVSNGLLKELSRRFSNYSSGETGGVFQSNIRTALPSHQISCECQEKIEFPAVGRDKKMGLHTFTLNFRWQRNDPIIMTNIRVAQ